MDNLVSGMCVWGGYDRVPFKVVGDGRADAGLKTAGARTDRKELLGADKSSFQG